MGTKDSGTEAPPAADLDYTVLNFLSKKTVPEQDRILARRRLPLPLAIEPEFSGDDRDGCSASWFPPEPDFRGGGQEKFKFIFFSAFF